MSFSNRLLFNRVSIYHQESLEVMLASAPGRSMAVRMLSAALGAKVMFADERVGYLRVRVPTRKLAKLILDPAVAAYQISSYSMAAWYRDGQPEANAKMFRKQEVRMIGGDPESQKERKTLPFLDSEEANMPGYTADTDTGVGEWLSRNPSWDGRGVTIALLESGEAEFTHPVLRGAKTLSGGNTAKISGVVNTLDPSTPDRTRVDMSTVIHATTVWYTVGSRTWILPRPGTFRFGVFSIQATDSVNENFAVLWDEKTEEIWVDTNGDASFENEQVIHDVNRRFDVSYLNLTYPKEVRIPFVVGKGRDSHCLHLYLARDGHQTMTASVAAGSRVKGGVASGVAPGARILLVRTTGQTYRLSDLVEGYLQIARRPDVDILCDSAGIMPVPDGAADFLGVVFRRLISAYGKPVFHSAGNHGPEMQSASALGPVFSVGGSIGPETYAAIYGGGSVKGLIVHPTSAMGPGGDGTLKPDFLAPMNRIAASVCVGGEQVALPKNTPRAQLSRCYEVSCCTSASSPYAAGLAALLVSAAKQQRIPYTAESLGRALKVGARFLPDQAAYAQGSGVLNVEAAWKELKRREDVPRIVLTAPVASSMTKYDGHPGQGGGLFDQNVGSSDRTGERIFRLRRKTGPRLSVAYHVTWTGNDGTFEAPATVELPLDKAVALPVKIAVSPGVHSAILNLIDPANESIVQRTAATVISPLRFSTTDHYVVQFSGAVPLMGTHNEYISVPPGVGALEMELNVTHGSLSVRILPPTALYPYYYSNLMPDSVDRTLTPGTYKYVVPNPVPGTWSLAAVNESAWAEKDQTLVSTAETTYSWSVRLLTASVTADADGPPLIDFANRGASLAEPAVDVSLGRMSIHRANFLSTGEPNLFELEVPVGSATLRLRSTANPGASDLELYLYDCTSGQCFSHEYEMPSARQQAITVRRPKPGKWIAAVNAAPSVIGQGGFVLEEVFAEKPSRRRLGQGDAWNIHVERAAEGTLTESGIPVVLCELVDAALERDEAERPMAKPEDMGKLSNRPVALATIVQRLR